MPLQLVPRDERPFDVIVWGASGFTGRLVALWLSGSTGRKPVRDAAGLGKLRWALAGRNESKLQQVKSELRLDSTMVEEPAILIADSDDQQSLQRMTAQGRVVLTTVGPYAQHGEPLVASCIKTSTDYCDITGESPWAAQMIAKYSEAAARSGSLLVHMSGFDSVPADLCAFLAADELRNKYGLQTGHMQGYCSVKGGGVSGGTIASALYMQDHRERFADVGSITQPYMLNPPDFKYPRARAGEKDQMFPAYDSSVQKFTTPFLMAVINSRVVRRSLALRRQFERETDGFGPEATYNECMLCSSPVQAFVVWLGLAIMGLLLMFSPTRSVVKRFLPQPGEGPSEAKRQATTFEYRVRAEGYSPLDEAEGRDSRVFVEARMAGRDPGYDDTAKFLGELGLLLAHERDALPVTQMLKGRTAKQGPVGGFFTPSIVGGQRYAERLKQAGLEIDVREVKKSRAGAAAAGSSSKND